MANDDITLSSDILVNVFGGPSKVAAHDQNIKLSTAYSWTRDGIPKHRRETVAIAAYEMGLASKLRAAHREFLDPDGRIAALNIQTVPKVTAAQKAKRAIAKVKDKAEQLRPGWTAEAGDWLYRYAETHDEFIVEDAKQWAYDQGFDPPHNDGAWGHVTRTASAKNYIKFIRYAEKSDNANRHGTPSRLWRSLIYTPQEGA